MRALNGVLPIIHTPLLDDDQIDFATLRRTVDWIYQTGADGLGTGMVSEILKLTIEERCRLTETLAEANDDRGSLFVAVGAESIKQAVALARHAQTAGCHAVMAAPPLTSRMSVRGHLDYYCPIIDAVDLPVIVQDASGYVGSAIPLEVYLELLKKYGPDRILFKPEAAPIGPALSTLRDATQGAAKIFDGSGGILLVDCYRRGIEGTMPGTDLLDGIVALWDALRRGDDGAIYKLYYPICAIVTLQMQAGLDGFLAIEKYLLVQRGLWCSDRRRLPYNWSLDRETAAEVNRLWQDLKSALAAYQHDRSAR